MPGEHEREQVKSDQAQTVESDDRYTAFGYALFCLVLALFLFAAPSYFSIGSVVGSMFGKSVGSMVGTVTSITCYIAAVILAFYTASFTLSAFDKHPEPQRRSERGQSTRNLARPSGPEPSDALGPFYALR